MHHCLIDIKQIVEFLDLINQNPEIIRSTEREIMNACSLDNPKENGVCFFKQKRWAEQSIDLSKISLLITSDESISRELIALAEKSDCAIIKATNPRLAFIYIIGSFFEPKPLYSIHKTAVVAETAVIHSNCSIGAGVYLGSDVEIGENTIIDANVSIGDGTIVGKNCYISSGTAIGQPGFGYERDDNGQFIQFPHIGKVIIGDDVHIGANTCIDRGTLDNTVIQDRVKIDNLCHISHNVHIGSDCAIIANSMIGGSVKIGAGSWVAPSASVINGITLGQNSTVGMAAVVTKPVSDNTIVAGSPAVTIQELKIQRARLKELLG